MVILIQFYYFLDVSMIGYGQCLYVCLVDDKGQIYCFLIMGKVRVVFLKMVIILCLEFIVVVVLVRVSEMFCQEFQYESVEEIFWIDSKVVLGYIKNDLKRFYVFVVNCV